MCFAALGISTERLNLVCIIKAEYWFVAAIVQGETVFQSMRASV